MKKFSLFLIMLSSVCIAQNGNLSNPPKGDKEIKNWADVAANASVGMMSMYAGYYSNKQIAGKNSKLTAPWPGVEEYQKAMDFEKKSSECMEKLTVANLQSGYPLRYYGDSSELMINVEGSKVRMYTPKGMVEIDGTNCKSVDSSKKVVDGMIEIAKHSVSMNTEIISERSRTMDEAQREQKNVIDMLQSCGQVDNKFEDYSKKTLQEKYKVAYRQSSEGSSNGCPVGHKFKSGQCVLNETRSSR